MLPKYKAHKVVEAFKIGALSATLDLTWVLYPLDGGFGPVVVTRAYMDRHQPKVGGYYVRYPDGYESWSPAAAFEDGYTLIKED